MRIELVISKINDKLIPQIKETDHPMDPTRSLVPLPGDDIIIATDVTIIPGYGNELTTIASTHPGNEEGNAFTRYQAKLTPNTRARHKDDLTNFHTFLLSQGTISRTPGNFYRDPLAWHDMNRTVLEQYITWQENQGFSSGSIKVRTSTVRTYCKLAGDEYVLPEVVLDQILKVKAYNAKEARNIDATRVKNGQVTRVGKKKAKPTQLETDQALSLKKTTIKNIKPSRRAHDQILAARDALMMGLFIEHAFRCSEVVKLNIENFDTKQGIVYFEREKTALTDQKHSLYKHTKLAAQHYIRLVEQIDQRTTGPLFLGYGGKRISRQAINARVKDIGKELGIEGLSPHDLRHYWTYDALNNGTPLEKARKAGGWKRLDMLLQYAEREGIDNEGVTITEE